MLAMMGVSSFHTWKFSAGSVLFGWGLFFAVLLVNEMPTDDLGLFHAAVTISLFLAAAVLFYRSKLPWSGRLFVWPYVASPKRESWRFKRLKLHWLDVALICSLLVSIMLLVNAFWPKAVSWQQMAFVIGQTALFLSGVAFYAVRFLPDKPWIDNVVTVLGSLIAVGACITLGLQPV
jgi:hypothetical protein